MQQTRVFLSSTCFDLASVREMLECRLRDMGHVPILSERPTFAVNSAVGTVENCRAIVRASCDVFVLIIAGRRGSIDLASGKSITNLEYLEAKSVGLPIIVLVAKPLLDLLPIWERNPSIDLAPIADDPAVLRFVSEIRNANQWTFPFAGNDDIVQTIASQLSASFRRLLSERRALARQALEPFLAESDRARALVVDRSANWQIHLFRELLRPRAEAAANKIGSLRAGFEFLKRRSMSHREYFHWIGSRPQEIGQATHILQAAVIERLERQRTGDDASPLEILACVNSVETVCNGLIEWERDQRSVIPPTEFEKVHACTLEWGGNIVLDIERFYRDLAAILDRSDLEGTNKVELVLRELTHLEQFADELDRLKEDSRLLLKIADP